MAQVQLTIATDPKSLPAANAHYETLIRLLSLGLLPTESISFTLETPDERAELLKAKLRAALEYRPAGLTVKIKTKTEEEVYTKKMTPVYPLDVEIARKMQEAAGERVADQLQTLIDSHAPEAAAVAEEAEEEEPEQAAGTPEEAATAEPEAEPRTEAEQAEEDTADGDEILRRALGESVDDRGPTFAEIEQELERLEEEDREAGRQEQDPEDEEPEAEA